jgi:UPF0176 protein
MPNVAAFYHFTPFDRPAALKAPLAAICCAYGVTGTVILAKEGINGTIAGTREGIDAVLNHVRALPGCAGIVPHESATRSHPFGRMKVRVKDEIVSMGAPGVDANGWRGTYVEPSDWNALISAPDVTVIDTRNAYEVAIGSFDGAVDPGTDSFREFPAWWSANRDRFAGQQIAMFCTGGIRCEKATAHLRRSGAGNVYHLSGGILGYLEQVPAAESLWRGECFVFDDRVSVGHGLREGPHTLCHACRRPLAPADQARPEFEDGVACHHCTAETSAADKARFRERQRQIAHARRRGDRHLGRAHTDA